MNSLKERQILYRNTINYNKCRYFNRTDFFKLIRVNKLFKKNSMSYLINDYQKGLSNLEEAIKAQKEVFNMLY